MKYSNDPMHTLKSLDEIVKFHTTKDTPLMENPTITEFFADRDVFLTGGSGFIGKALIEKLLRSCPDIKTIYVLIRSKKGKPIEQRLEEILKNPVFGLLRAINPDFHKKLVPIEGDVAELKLGLSETDMKRMENVSIIFHSAACVRFDDPFKHAILMNTRGTREVMRFAEKLRNIRLVMHISTTFSNVYTHVLEEKLYPPMADSEKTIEICEKLDEETLNSLSQHYINFMPNTYVFSKNLAEHITNSYKDKLPVILFRPSIVIGAVMEPIQGWVDNVNGPMGILMASCAGVSKTMYCDPKNTMDVVPIDTCIKVMLIAAWKRAHENEKELEVLNCAAGKESKVTVSQILDIGIHGACEEIPMEKMVLLPSGGVTLSKQLNLIRLLIYQVLPAIIFDLVLKFRNEKPRLMKLQRKMYEANKALGYFVTNTWEFKNDKLLKFPSLLRPEDLKAFDFSKDFFYDRVLYVRYAILGFRRFLLLEKDESLPECRRKNKRLMFGSALIKMLFWLGVFYIVTVYYDTIIKPFRDRLVL